MSTEDDDKFPHTLPYQLVWDVEQILLVNEDPKRTPMKVTELILRWAAAEVRFKDRFGHTPEFMAQALEAQAGKAHDLVWIEKK